MLVALIRRWLKRPDRGFAWIGGVGLLVLAACTAAPLDSTPSAVVSLLQEGHCGACHYIPNVPHATGMVGPPLCQVGEAYRRGETTIEQIMADIAQPNGRVHEGYLSDVMPATYQEDFTESELRQMAQYLSQLECPPLLLTPTETASGE